MTGPTTRLGNADLDAMTEFPLLASIWRRRTHPVSADTSARSMPLTSSSHTAKETELCGRLVKESLTSCPL